MLKSEMVAKNPLRAFDQNRDGGLEPGQSGMIAARAGTGKTALLIQLSLDNLFRGNSVLHVSIGETVTHVQAWYEEIFRDLSLGYDLEQSRTVWDEAVAGRLILTFRKDLFSIPTLKERLTDLVEQVIFKPRVVVIDGLDLNSANHELFEEVKNFARESGLKVWSATRTHRDDGEIGALLEPLNDVFDVVLAIAPSKDALKLTAYKNPRKPDEQITVDLDPKTMLLVST